MVVLLGLYHPAVALGGLAARRTKDFGRRYAPHLAGGRRTDQLRHDDVVGGMTALEGARHLHRQPKSRPRRPSADDSLSN
jgi:hypothetical protein